MIGNTELLAILAILLFVIFLLFAILASRKSQEEKISQTQALGFEPLVEPPPELMTHLEELYHNEGNQTLKLRNLYQRREFDRDLYLFDLVNTHNENTSMGTGVFGVISRQLALPRFSLASLPPLDTQRILGNLMDKILDKFFDWAGKHQGLIRVEFPDQPDFDEKFVVFDRDEYALRDLFSGTNARALPGSKLPFQLAGADDFLTIDYSYTSSHDNQDSDLRTQYQQFLDLVRTFEER